MGKKQTEALLLALAVAVLLVYTLTPRWGTYKLKAGHAACLTKSAVAEYRGARMLGILAKGMVLATKRCVLIGSQPVKVLRRSTFFDLPQKIQVGDRIMYADHDAVESL